MRKVYYLSLVLSGLLFTTISNAQDLYLPCKTHSMTDEVLKNDPEAVKRVQELDNFTREYIKNNPQRSAAGDNYAKRIIPVVIHVLHKGGGENISDEQIHDAIRIINVDFQKRNADTANVLDTFKAIIGDLNLEFRLATKDPNGKPTNGITRTYTDVTSSGDDAKIKAIDPWDSRNYLNVWTVTNANGAGAYAYKPGSWPAGSNRDGIVCLYTQFGGIGASGGNFAARTLTHEIGHYMNLDHTWGGSNDPGISTNCNLSDQVDDTPKTIGVVGQGCNKSAATCGDHDNVENYMDYSNCGKMFTQGQTARMNAALNGTASGRNNLWSSTNLTATGTADPYAPVDVPPIANFYNKDLPKGCTGQNVQFFQQITNDHKDSVAYLWTFVGGNPVNSTEKNPSITYDQPGKYSVKLKVSNAAGSDSLTKTDLVEIFDNTGEAIIPIAEDFDGTTLISGWQLDNTSGGVKWESTTEAAYSGTSSYYIRNFSGNPNTAKDAFILPSLDLSDVTSDISIKFNIAYAMRNTSSKDKLTISISTNCGKSYSPLFDQQGVGLSTTEETGSEFFPTIKDEWRAEEVDLSNYAGESKVLIKFENTSNAGNNIFIDDIKVVNPLLNSAQSLQAKNIKFRIMPNPSNEHSVIEFNLLSSKKVSVGIYDLLGREVGSLVKNQNLDFGTHSYTIDKNEIGAGMYLVKLTIDGESFARKLIFN